jgi:hypothetical protein
MNFKRINFVFCVFPQLFLNLTSIYSLFSYISHFLDYNYDII